MTTTQEIRNKFIEDSKAAKQQKQYQSLLASCSKADRESVKLLEQIDLASGGQLDRLVAVYSAIKQSS